MTAISAINSKVGVLGAIKVGLDMVFDDDAKLIGLYNRYSDEANELK